VSSKPKSLQGYWHRDIKTFEWLAPVLHQRECLAPKLKRTLLQPQHTLDACLAHTFYPKATEKIERWADP